MSVFNYRCSQKWRDHVTCSVVGSSQSSFGRVLSDGRCSRLYGAPNASVQGIYQESTQDSIAGATKNRDPARVAKKIFP